MRGGSLAASRAAGAASMCGCGRGPWIGRDGDGYGVAPDIGVGDGLAGLALSGRIVGTGWGGRGGFSDGDGRGWGEAVASRGAMAHCGRWSRWSGSEGIDGLYGTGLIARGGCPDLCREPSGVVCRASGCGGRGRGGDE
jgi:hypothetical protein